MLTQQQIYTVDEFENIISLPENHERLLVLVNGEVKEKAVTQEHRVIAILIGSPLFIYIETHKLGYMGIEIYYVHPDDRRNSRLPDVSFTSSHNIVKKGAVLNMPDLAVEIQSPDDKLTEMREKAHFYLAHGSRMVWLVYPATRIVEVLTPDGEQVLGEDGVISGGDVLPGFTLAVKDIFPA